MVQRVVLEFVTPEKVPPIDILPRIKVVREEECVLLSIERHVFVMESLNRSRRTCLGNGRT